MVVASRRAGATLSPESLLDHFRALAPRHMVPRYIEITDAPLPRTPTEKIARSVLRQRGVGPDTFDRGSR
jgi:crotonobetaine/carnitine-CoA ligase